MALLDNDMQINNFTPRFVETYSLEVRPLSDLVSRWVTCVGLGNAFSWPLGLHGHMGSSGWGPGLWWGSNSPGNPRFVRLHGMNPHYFRNSNDKPCHKHDQGEGDWCPGNALVKCSCGPSPVSMKGCNHGGRWPNCWELKLGWIQWNSPHQEYQDQGCLLIPCDNHKGRYNSYQWENWCDDSGSVCRGWFPTTGPDSTKCLYWAEKGGKNAIMVVRNSMAYPQTLRKKTLVARAVMVTWVPEPLV